MDDDVTTRVPLHDLASRVPSAPNQTDGRTNTGPSHNIYRASIASRDNFFIYLCVGHLKVVPLYRRRNFLFLVTAEVSFFPSQAVSEIWHVKKIM